MLRKAVLHAIPSYCMSSFLIPPSLSDELQKMINSFLWGKNNQGNRGIHCLSWERLSVSKEHGGMGFRDLQGLN